MTLHSPVKVYAAGVACFGGVTLRRVRLNVAGTSCAALLHEQGEQVIPYLLEQCGDGAPGSAPLHLMADWGEPLAPVSALHCEDSGEISAYTVRLKTGQDTTVSAADTYWWNGELYARKRVSYAVRDLLRGKKGRVRAQAA